MNLNNYFFRKIDKYINFTFIYDEVKELYYKNNNVFSLIQYKSYGQENTKTRKWEFEYLKKMFMTRNNNCLAIKNIDFAYYLKLLTNFVDNLLIIFLNKTKLWYNFN